MFASFFRTEEEQPKYSQSHINTTKKVVLFQMCCCRHIKNNKRKMINCIQKLWMNENFRKFYGCKNRGHRRRLFPLLLSHFVSDIVCPYVSVNQVNFLKQTKNKNESKKINSIKLNRFHCATIALIFLCRSEKSNKKTTTKAALNY